MRFLKVGRIKKIRSEVFFNEVLAPDQITRLLDDKVFTNWKRYDKDGEHDLDELKDDDNLIIKGNNLVVLHSLKKRYAGRVKMIYIDPPYNTGSDSFGYNDRFNHSTWLTFMKNRLEVAKELLSDDGILAIQCDYHEDAYLRVLTDGIFNKDNFVQSISVKMSDASGPKMAHAKTNIPKLKETILIYKKQSFKLSNVPSIVKAKWDNEYKKVISGLTREEITTVNQYLDKDEATQEDCDALNKVLTKTKIESFTMHTDLKGSELETWFKDNSWRMAGDKQNTSLDKKLVSVKHHPGGQIACTLNTKGKLILYRTDKTFGLDTRVEIALADRNMGSNPCDFWTDISTAGGVAKEGGNSLSGGKKPEKLIHRLIHMFTQPKDIVLDYHLGSGTTAAVAHKMGRQYIGIEQLYYGDNDPTNRLQNVINGDQSGISKGVNWQGGGSFVYTNIMNNANKFRKRVEAAKNDSDYLALLKEATSSSFLSYRVDPKKLSEEEFRKLSASEKRRLLLELIDNNTLYVNYEDINDPIFKVSEKDKELNKKLYEKN